MVVERFSNETERPDYTLTLNGVSKIFVEAKNLQLILRKKQVQLYSQEVMDGTQNIRFLYYQTLNI